MAGEQPSRKGSWDAGWQQLSKSQQCAVAARRANPILVCIKHSISSWSIELIIPLCSVWVHHPEHGVQFWASQFKEDVKVLECIQRRAIKLATGLKGMSCEKQLRILG